MHVQRLHEWGCSPIDVRAFTRSWTQGRDIFSLLLKKSQPLNGAPSSAPQPKTRWRNAVSWRRRETPFPRRETDRDRRSSAGWNVPTDRLERHLIRNPQLRFALLAGPLTWYRRPGPHITRFSHGKQSGTLVLVCMRREHLRVSGPERADSCGVLVCGY